MSRIHEDDVPGPAPGTLATDQMSNKRVGDLVSSITVFDRELRGLGMVEPVAPLVINTASPTGMWLEVLVTKYTGASAHHDRQGRRLTPMADGLIRRFKVGAVEFRYRTTIGD